MKQEYPFSPFLFTLAMDYISSILKNEFNFNKYNCFILRQCHVSYLLFIDDLLIIGAPNIIYVNILKFLLDILASYIGLGVNCEQSMFQAEKAMQSI